MHARGITLVEAVISTLLVGVMLVSAIHMLATAKAGQVIVQDRRLGSQLADDLMEEILSHPYADETEIEGLFDVLLGPLLGSDLSYGPESGESGTARLAFDDVDDFHGWTSTPPVHVDGVEVPGAGAYTRSVTVTPVEPTNPRSSSAEETGARLVTVTISRGGAEVTTRTRVVTLNVTPTQACSLPDGTCIDLPEDLCAKLGGTALGVGTTCLMDAPDDWVAPTGPIVHYALDEGAGSNAADSENAHDATVFTANWTTGMSGNALAFSDSSGSYEYAAAPDTDLLDLTDQFTIAAWVRFGGGSHDHAIVTKGWGSSVNYGLCLDRNGQLLFRYSSLLAVIDVHSTLMVTEDAWVFVAVSVDGNALTFAVDDQQSTLTKARSLTTNSNALMIGLGPDVTDQFNGDIDEIRIYDRAMTADELESLRIDSGSGVSK